MSRARKIQQFLSQPFFVAAQFTGIEGQVRADRRHDHAASREIVDGKHDGVPEQAFYLVGTIEEALAKAKTIKQ